MKIVNLQKHAEMMKIRDTTAPNFSNTNEQLEKSSAYGQKTM